MSGDDPLPGRPSVIRAERSLPLPRGNKATPRPGRIAALACVALESMRLAGRPCSCSRRTSRRSPSMQHRQRSVANCQSVARGFVPARREYLRHLLTTTLFPLPISRPHANRSSVVAPRELHGTGFAKPSMRSKRHERAHATHRRNNVAPCPPFAPLTKPVSRTTLHRCVLRLSIAPPSRPPRVGIEHEGVVMAVCPSLRSSCEPRHLNIQSEEGSQ
jgi:hypothetical protein